LSEEGGQHRTGSVLFESPVHGLADLAEDLRFAKDHRLKARGHTEEMVDRRFIGQRVEVGGNLFLGYTVKGAEEGDEGIEGVGRRKKDIDLCPIAGGQDNALANSLMEVR
jgi:hypothetical protein